MVWKVKVLGGEKAYRILLNNYYTDTKSFVVAKDQLQEDFKLTDRLIRLSLICLPGHRNIFGIEKADELVMSGGSQNRGKTILCRLVMIKREHNMPFEQIA